jgi:uncharacterized protein (TIGR02284 family)
MSNKQVIVILNDLVDTCREGHDVYRKAAEAIRNSEFRRMFNIFSQQRAQFVTELDAEVHRLGGPHSEVSIEDEGWLRRSWTDLKLKLGGSDEPMLIAQCQRFEESAISRYQDALKEDLPLDVQYVVKRQYMDIKDAYDRIRILQRAA